MTWLNREQLSTRIARLVLAPAAIGYGFGSYCRLRAYASRLLKRERPPVPVISIGNITCGGTGKTPLTIDIAQRLVQAGYKPAVLSRGYKRKSNAPYIVVSDGKSIFCTCEDAGDEPFLIAQKAQGTAVIVGGQRKLTARVAVNKYDCDVIILDDGFQHLALDRDFDIVLLDYNDDIAQDALLPAGRLREPPGALGRSQCVLITKVPAAADETKLQKLGEFIHRYSPHSTIGLIHFVTQIVSPIPGRSALAFCGIARPQAFFESLNSLDIRLVGRHIFPDHHWYRRADIAALAKEARELNADFLITTEKDLVKLRQLWPSLEKEIGKPVVAAQLTTHWIGSLPAYLADLLASKGVIKEFQKTLAEKLSDREETSLAISETVQST